MTIVGTILANILLNRLNEDQTGLLPESQCGFRKDRGIVAMIFTARQFQEKCQNMDFYMTFVDLIKSKVQTEAVDELTRQTMPQQRGNAEAVDLWSKE